MQDKNKREYTTYADYDYVNYLDRAKNPAIYLGEGKKSESHVKYKVTIERILPKYIAIFFCLSLHIFRHL